MQLLRQSKQAYTIIVRTFFVLCFATFNYIIQVFVIFALIRSIIVRIRCIALQLSLLFLYLIHIFFNFTFFVIYNIFYLRNLIQNYVNIRYNIKIYTKECN